MTFRVGQKVVCVDDRPGQQTGERTLRRGAVYTVTNVCYDGLGIHVDGAFTRNPNGWWRHRFRPVVERKTDISVFTAMLHPSSSKLEKIGADE